MFSLLKLIGGYCKVTIIGAGKERFLNLCKNKKILIWNLIRKEDGYTFFVSFKAYSMLDEIGEKSNTHISIEGKYGLPFFLYRNKKRKMFYAGMVFCGIIIFVLSLFIWDIQIKGMEGYTEDEIRTYLREKGIYTGVLKRKIDCDWLEEAIREDFEESAWVSCDITGTLFTVHIKESIETKDIMKEKEAGPNDIIAAKDGVIESIITRNGTPLVKQGMEVKQGDTLISGIISYYNDYDELLETRKISADGDIRARTVYSYQDRFSLTYYEKEYTGKSTKEYRVSFHDLNLPSIGKKHSYHDFDTITENYKARIGKNFYLPVSLQVKKYMEYRPSSVSLTEEEARKKASQKAEYYVEQLKSRGKVILTKDIEIHVSDRECNTNGKIVVIESIGKIRNIP